MVTTNQVKKEDVCAGGEGNKSVSPQDISMAK